MKGPPAGDEVQGAGAEPGEKLPEIIRCIFLNQKKLEDGTAKKLQDIRAPVGPPIPYDTSKYQLIMS